MSGAGLGYDHAGAYVLGGTGLRVRAEKHGLVKRTGFYCSSFWTLGSWVASAESGTRSGNMDMCLFHRGWVDHSAFQATGYQLLRTISINLVRSKETRLLGCYSC